MEDLEKQKPANKRAEKALTFDIASLVIEKCFSNVSVNVLEYRFQCFFHHCMMDFLLSSPKSVYLYCCRCNGIKVPFVTVESYHFIIQLYKSGVKKKVNTVILTIFTQCIVSDLAM